MKIYLLEDTKWEAYHYDTYDSCVVVANDENDAKTIAPDGNVFKEYENYGIWADSIQDIKVTEIGEATLNQRRGVICASFNAG